MVESPVPRMMNDNLVRNTYRGGLCKVCRVSLAISELNGRIKVIVSR
jgi:hypothetical protein